MKRLCALAGLGLVGSVLYWQLAANLSLDSEVIPRFLIWFGLCFALQLAALWIARRIDDRPIQLAAAILVFGLLFRGLLLPVAQIHDDDVHRFLWDGRVTAAGENPYRFSPQEVYDASNGRPLDAYSSSERERLGRLVELANENRATEKNFAGINYPGVKTVYPPFCQWLFGGAHVISPESFVLYKFLLCMIELATMLLLLCTLRRLDAPIHWLLLHAWSPLAIKEFAGTGHHDALALLFLSLCLYLLAAERVRLAAGALAATVLSKLFALVLLPLLLRRMGRGGLALFLLVLAIGLLPFADAGPDLVSGLTTFGKQWEFNAGLYSLLAIPLGPRGARAAAAALLLALAGFCFCREETSLPILLDRLLGMLALLLLLSPVVDPWYVTWLLPLLVVRPFGPLIAWTGLVALHYCYFIQDADQWWIRPLQYLPLYVYLALEGWRWCRRSGIVRPAGK